MRSLIGKFVVVLLTIVAGARGAERVVPNFPEPGQRIRLLIDTDAPNVDWDMRYLPTKSNGRIRRVYQIDRDRTFDLFHRRLAELASSFK